MEKPNNIEFNIYCNEKDYKGTGFFFACCPGCKHNPITEHEEA